MMSRPSTVVVQCCPECDGARVTTEWDGDSEDPSYVTVRCEACRASGCLTDCLSCGEVIALPTFEELGGLCDCCAHAAENSLRESVAWGRAS